MEQTRPPYVRPPFPYGLFYLAAALVLIDQVSEVLTSLAPYRWGSAEWRFGAYGILLGRTTSMILVAALVILAGWARNDRRFLRLVGGLHLALTVGVLVGLGFFGLDFLEFRRRVGAGLVGPVNYAAGRAAAVSVLVAIYGIAMSIGLLRATRRRSGRDEPPVFVVGGGRGHD